LVAGSGGETVCSFTVIDVILFSVMDSNTSMGVTVGGVGCGLIGDLVVDGNSEGSCLAF